MQTVIYADLLVILNMIVTLIIIIITSDILNIDSYKTRYIAGSVAGGALSLIILAPPLNVFYSIVVKMLTSGVIVLLAFRIRSIKIYLKCFFLFNGISLLLAGIMLFTGMIINGSNIISNNGYVYVDFSISAVILIICASFVIIKTVNRKIFIKTKNELIFDAEIIYKDRKVLVRALFDSGNSLVDIFTGRPVIILSVDDIEALVETTTFNEIRRYFDFGEYENCFGMLRLLPVKTLGNSCFIPAFTAERAIVTGNEIVRIVEKPTIAVTDNTFEEKNYSALINESVTGQVI